MLGVSLELNPDLSEKDNCQVLDNLAMHRPETVLFVNWAKVAEIPAFSLPEAVALSLGLSPEYAYLPWAKEFLVLLKKNAPRNAEHRKALWEKMKQDKNKEALEYQKSLYKCIHRHRKHFAEIEKRLLEFIDRLHIAENNLHPLGEIEIVDGGANKINLSAFGAWATERKWDLSDQFPRKELEKSLGKRERETLLVLIAALAKDAKIDISKPSAIAASIENSTKELGARISVRTIEEKLKLIPEAIKNFKD